MKSEKLERAIEELYLSIMESTNTLVITGAGISIAAGGVTYSGMASRSRGGFLNTDDPDSLYATYYRTFLGSMFEHGPTGAHKALAELEADGKIQGIITTNVDCMHTMAGSTNVAEIQGSFQVNVCPKCQHVTYGYDIWRDGRMPQCENCGENLLPYNMYSHAGILYDELSKAQRYISKADLILIIGANGCYTHLYWNYRKRNAKVIQINPGMTYFDTVADLNVRGEADPIFIEVMKKYHENKEIEKKESEE